MYWGERPNLVVDQEMHVVIGIVGHRGGILNYVVKTCLSTGNERRFLRPQIAVEPNPLNIDVRQVGEIQIGAVRAVVVSCRDIRGGRRQAGFKSVPFVPS